MMANNVLVTGSSRGIGESLGQIFANNNWNVCFTSRSKKDLDKINESFQNKNNLFHETNFLNIDEISKLANYLNNNWEKLDALIINLGGGRGQKYITSNFNDNLKIFKLNFYTAFLTSQILTSLLVKSKNPSIVLIGSIAANTNVDSPINYAMSKKALETHSVYLSRSLAKFKIRVNSVNLGHVLTENGYWQNKKLKEPESFKNLLTNNTLTGQIFMPEEVSSFIFYLINSVHTTNLTGNIFTLDCGVSKIK